jgi:hypothetical protein
VIVVAPKCSRRQADQGYRRKILRRGIAAQRIKVEQGFDKDHRSTIADARWRTTCPPVSQPCPVRVCDPRCERRRGDGHSGILSRQAA